MRVPPFYTVFCVLVVALYAYGKYEGLAPWGGTTGSTTGGSGGSGGSYGGSGFHYVGTSSGGSHK